ncbi:MULTISPECIES: LmbU family transcriptional regulator [Frankia]|nr:MULTISPECIES: LmbU family transcriptional regulator [Frankia]
MMNQIEGRENSDVLTSRAEPEGVPRARRPGGQGPRLPQVLTTKVGLHIPPGLAFEDWERAGRQLSGLIDSSSWWLGDWLIYGKDQYVDRYERGIRAAGLQYQTLRNYSWVCRRFDMPRRRSALSFQHHAELASLPVDEQDAWLDRAEHLKWTTKQLRNAVRAGRQRVAGPTSTAIAPRALVLPDHRLQRWHTAAIQVGSELSAWVTTTLDAAASQVLKDRKAEPELPRA